VIVLAFFVFLMSQKKYLEAPGKNSIRDAGLSSPIPSLTKNLWRPQEKLYKRSRALQPNPFPYQKSMEAPEKNH